jgi:hypothetical protein
MRAIAANTAEHFCDTGKESGRYRGIQKEYPAMERMTRKFAKMAFSTTKSIAQWPKKRLKICFAELEPRMRTMIKTASTAKIQISAIMGRSLPPRARAFDCGDFS